MKLVSKRPTVKMTRAEAQAIRDFLDVMQDEALYDYPWDELAEDFPRTISKADEYIVGEIYDISITD